MKVSLQYGSDDLDIQLPEKNVTLIEPRTIRGLPDEQAAFREALENPFACQALKEQISATDTLAIVIPDGTRAMPLERILPWLMQEIDHVPAGNIVIINGTGTHRANTSDELRGMLGNSVFKKYRIINHNAQDAGSHVYVGDSLDGKPIRLEQAYVEADKRIVMGFIEPHFWAGFSGGFKGVFPAIADLDSIMHYHRASVIADPRSTWGRLEDNPTLDQVRHNGSLVSIDFLINLTLNRQKEITGFFCGEAGQAHAAGCHFARENAMVGVGQSFPIVITSNSGYPLDQNLYQTIKGISAAAQIVEDGGLILVASECRDGFPDHGRFKDVLFEEESPDAVLKRVMESPCPFHDQWQIQATALLMQRARVGMKSSLSDEDLRRAHIEPVEDLDERIRQELEILGPDARIAVLPEGPQTIPYLK